MIHLLPALILAATAALPPATPAHAEWVGVPLSAVEACHQDTQRAFQRALIHEILAYGASDLKTLARHPWAWLSERDPLAMDGIGDAEGDCLAKVLGPG